MAAESLPLRHFTLSAALLRIILRNAADEFLA